MHGNQPVSASQFQNPAFAHLVFHLGFAGIAASWPVSIDSAQQFFGKLVDSVKGVWRASEGNLSSAASLRHRNIAAITPSVRFLPSSIGGV